MALIHEGEPDPRWSVQPLRELDDDVPLPFVVEGLGDQLVAVTLTIGQTLLIAPDGTVSNSHGTPLFRLSEVRSR